MKGFFNKLLRVDLKTRSYAMEDISDEVLKATLGGKGLGIHLLMENVPAGADPLSEDNPFIIVTGPVTGSRFWSQARFASFTKSPLTGGFGESYCGGSLAPMIKGIGVDAVILTGKSESSVWLSFDEDGLTFHDAEDLWGKDTIETEEVIRERENRKCGVMSIGPAGENLIPYSCIKSDYRRSLGRSGMGAVLGSKRVKAISFSGKQKPQWGDVELLQSLTKKIWDEHKNEGVTQTYRTFGTTAQVAVTNKQNCFPTRYWHKGHLDNFEKISGDYMLEHLDVNSNPCPNCFLRCTKQVTVKEGRHKGLMIDGPEFETIYALGGLNELDSFEEIVHLNDKCDRYGVDTMETGNILAFATEASRKGNISFSIDYNMPEKMDELLTMIVKREGEGEIFSEGVRRAAEKLGMEKEAIHVKGMSPAGFDPRVLKGMGLSYATSARGACHLRGTFYKAELSGMIDKEQIEGKAQLMVDFEDRAALFDSLILCRFYRDFIQWEELRSLFKATMGMDLSKKELAEIANGITQKTREFNRREGIGEEEDTLPTRFLTEKTEEGFELSEEKLSIMLREYNAIRADRGAHARS